jgi:hypothetical protein
LSKLGLALKWTVGVSIGLDFLRRALADSGNLKELLALGGVEVNAVRNAFGAL